MIPLKAELRRYAYIWLPNVGSITLLVGHKTQEQGTQEGLRGWKQEPKCYQPSTTESILWVSQWPSRALSILLFPHLLKPFFCRKRGSSPFCISTHFTQKAFILVFLIHFCSAIEDTEDHSYSWICRSPGTIYLLTLNVITISILCRCWWRL